MSRKGRTKWVQMGINFKSNKQFSFLKTMKKCTIYIRVTLITHMNVDIFISITRWGFSFLYKWEIFPPHTQILGNYIQSWGLNSRGHIPERRKKGRLVSKLIWMSGSQLEGYVIQGAKRLKKITKRIYIHTMPSTLTSSNDFNSSNSREIRSSTSLTLLLSRVACTSDNYRNSLMSENKCSIFDV